MENFYMVLVVVLFALAVSDLIVGVSNDAVNFLNSSFGSKSASKWLIFTVAIAGILVGVTFSNGMMEVARKGIFHPDMFSFSEIMVIFLAVMITDVLLLDVFNTLGLPTSTTVSLVFELLGSAVAVALVSNEQDCVDPVLLRPCTRHGVDALAHAGRAQDHVRDPGLDVVEDCPDHREIVPILLST